MALRAIVLVGLRAVGKSTVGRAVADQLGWELTDSDAELSAHVGKSAGEWLAEVGEPEFRRREEAVVLQLLGSAERAVIATGGGVVTIPAVRDALGEPDLLPVWLVAPTPVLIERARASAVVRPSLTGLPAAAEWEELRRRRDPFYALVARLTVDTSMSDPAAAAAAIVAACQGRGGL